MQKPRSEVVPSGTRRHALPDLTRDLERREFERKPIADDRPFRDAARKITAASVRGRAWAMFRQILDRVPEAGRSAAMKRVLPFLPVAVQVEVAEQALDYVSG